MIRLADHASFRRQTSMGERIPFSTCLRADHLTVRISHCPNELLPTCVAKKASFIVPFASNHRELLHCRFPTPFAPASCRGKVKRDRQAEFVVQHTAFLLSLACSCARLPTRV